MANFYSRNGIITAGEIIDGEISWIKNNEDNHFRASINYGKIMLHGGDNEKVGPTHDTQNVRATFIGNIIVPVGKSQLCTYSDDGSRVYVDGVKFVDNDGRHGPMEVCSHQYLSPGIHYIQILYFQFDSGK